MVDNESWILPYAAELVERVKGQGYSCALYNDYDSVPACDIAFLLGCTRIAPDAFIQNNRRNLVVHESDLPKGRGFAPLTWQILEGASEVTICLLEAASEVDSGPVYLRHKIVFEGHELNSELRRMQGEATIQLCMAYLNSVSEPSPCEQTGEPSYYARRRPADSELDMDRTLAQQFDLLRVVDNERYPAFFNYRGHRYRLRIEKADSSD